MLACGELDGKGCIGVRHGQVLDDARIEGKGVHRFLPHQKPRTTLSRESHIVTSREPLRIRFAGHRHSRHRSKEETGR